ncbi:family 78 glycoside hydrolase catalytic domain [Actinomadura sp. NBRC 104412]|uniref:family 78 glycoside hydrolase catalytic domain n=1 Tax=Actinomadura sp. NBRC 104412 TaxID=3032203 RepID=UPI0025535847|nr:family 78 glycoside hydrolase catalytic domain [Actinomadura sp. NBRC 104412]
MRTPQRPTQHRERFRSTLLILPAALVLVVTSGGAALAAPKGGGVRVLSTTTEYGERPLGLDDPAPRLSWRLGSPERNQSQSAYEIHVASSPAKLAKGDVWDSGKVASGQSVLVPYRGPALKPRTRYHWTVRVWDAHGRASSWSKPSWWETGLLDPAEWKGGWIGASADPDKPPALNGTSWIWYPEGDPAAGAPAGSRYFRGSFDLSGAVQRGRLVMTADDGFTAWVNGEQVADVEAGNDNWRRPVLVDVTGKLRQGRNTIAVKATNASASPAGLLGRLEVTTAEGVRTIDTSGDWRTVKDEPSGDWQAIGYDDSSWQAAKVAAAWGSGPWGRPQPADPTAPPSFSGASWVWYPEGDPAADAPEGTRYFRGSFDLTAVAQKGRLVMTADDGFTAWINGEQVADVEPGNDAWRRPVFVDVTGKLRQGRNTIAVKATNIAVNRPSPAGLLGRLEVTTAEGVRTIDTSGDWRTVKDEPSGDWQAIGYDDSSWQAAKVLAPWGSGPWGSVQAEPEPPGASLLRREFRLRGKRVAQARLYSTALGLYEAEINGHRVGEDVLAPGWTDYGTRVQYQTYDVTGLLRRGDNAIGVALAPGWYSGSVGMFGPRQYGDQPWLRAQLEVRYTDGTTDTIATGDGWRWSPGPVTSADLLMGESYDARLEQRGWSKPGFDDAAWRPVSPGTGITARPTAQIDAPIRVERELTPVKITQPRPGVHVFDLGQNMVGTVRLKVSGTAGQKVRIRHAEVLNKDGTIYTANLRTAKATDTYVLRGGGTEVYEPEFTFHGFRYVEVTGLPGAPSTGTVTGRVMHTAAPFTMDFKTNDGMLNQLHSNITWGQRGNFLSVPTDTPARDERLGWTGDINVFSRTATYNMESARFLSKWMQDMRDTQGSNGAFPDVAPRIGGLGEGVAGWGDAGVTVPWNLYRAYGDRRVLEQNYPAMRKWIAYLENNSNGLLRPAAGYGDWLNINDETPKDVISTAYFAYVTDLVADIARVLGKKDEAAQYDDLAGRVREAFNKAYVTEGRIKGDTQTAYVLALSMNLLPEAARKPAADRLVQLIEARDWHLSTGFLGTPQLLPVLTATGHTDVAYRLLHQRTFPSWGYQIDRGATTMWERWDSIRPDGSFQDAGMNSFNHYAYGAVGEWMYENITGISAGEPGYRRTVIRPRPGGDVNRASGRYDSVYGPIETSWWAKGGRFHLTVSVPVNTTAEVWVPARSAAEVSQSGARFLRMQDGAAVFTVGSGTYHFSARSSGTG